MGNTSFPAEAICAAIPRRPALAFCDCEERASAKRKRAAERRLVRLVHWGIVIALTAFLLFAHGCHGDDDSELFGFAQSSLWR